MSADLGGACSDDQGINTQNEGERGHHHGAKPHRCPEHRGLFDGLALLALILRKFNDQNAIFGGHRDENDKTDLGIEIEREAPDENAEKRSQIPIGTDNSTGTGIIQLS